MKKSFWVLLMMLALLATVATAQAQQAPDPRVADLVRAGKVRFALFLPGYIKDPATGEIRGAGTGAVTVQLARACSPPRGRGSPGRASESSCGRRVPQGRRVRPGIYGGRTIAGRGGRLLAAIHAAGLHLPGAGWLLDPPCLRRGPARGPHRGRAQSRFDLGSEPHTEARRSSRRRDPGYRLRPAAYRTCRRMSISPLCVGAAAIGGAHKSLPPGHLLGLHNDTSTPTFGESRNDHEDSAASHRAHFGESSASDFHALAGASGSGRRWSARVARSCARNCR